MSDGGPAFPGKHTQVRRVFSGRQHLGYGEQQDQYSEQEVEVLHSGMSLRDYFAAHAPFTYQDAFDRLDLEGECVGPWPVHRVMERLAELRMEYADAMLEARGKQP